MDSWSCAKLCKLMKSVDLPLYQWVGMEMVTDDQEGLWSGKKEGFGEVVLIKKVL